MDDVRTSAGDEKIFLADSIVTALGRLYKHLSVRRRRQLALLLLMMLIGAVAELATLGAVLPFLALMANPHRATSYPLLQELFAGFGWNNANDILLPATVLFAIIALCAGGIRLCLVWATQKFTLRVGHDLGTEVYRRTLYQPYSYHVSHNTSDIIAATNKAQLVAGGVLLPLMNALAGGVIAAFILMALLLIDVSVALVASIVLGAVYFTVSAITRTRLRVNSKIIADSLVSRVQAAQEGLGGIRDVLLDEAQSVYVRKFERTDLALVNAQTINAFIGVAPRFIIEAVGIVLVAMVAYLLSQGPGGLALALPTLGALALGAQRLLPLIQQIYFGWSQASGNRQLLTDVLTYMDLSLPQNDKQGRQLPTLPFMREIELDNVSFRYGAEHPIVFDNVKLKIAKGERVALVGKTGSGKSTMMDVIMGLLEPTSGRIKIDGVSVTSQNIRGWQSKIAHVPQAIYLSDATIAENIAFGVETTSVELVRVQRAARMAQLADFVENLPSSYQTVVGERGVRLSGGQRQRIGIARALYREASVLVFDEATSSLDYDTEAAVIDAINALDRSLTILIVAHRLNTIEMCDRMLVMTDVGVEETRCRVDQEIRPLTTHRP